MKVFDYKSFLGTCITAMHAQEVSKIADDVLNSASFVMYGKYVSGKYVDFSSDKKPGDTHCILAYGEKRMRTVNDSDESQP